MAFGIFYDERLKSILEKTLERKKNIAESWEGYGLHRRDRPANSELISVKHIPKHKTFEKTFFTFSLSFAIEIYARNYNLENGCIERVTADGRHLLNAGFGFEDNI